jgi:hypothetical protein
MRGSVKRGFVFACALALFVVAGVAGAVNEKDGGELNAFTKLARGSGPIDPGAGNGLTASGPFSKQQITAFRCSSAGNPAVSVDMSCNDPNPYGQDWNPDNEIAVAVDPEDPDHLLAGSNDYFYRFNNANGTRHVIVPTGFFTSFDGGATWVDGQIPFRSGNGAGDPSPGFVADPRSPTVNRPFALMAQLENVGPNTGCCVAQGNVTVSRSLDGGVTWQRPVVVFKGHGAGIGPANNAVFYDKEWLTVDNYPDSPFYGRIYVTATRFVNTLQGGFLRSPIVISYSDDGGLTWSPPKVISGSHPTCTSQSDGSSGTECDEDQNSIPEVASNGNVLVYFGNYQNEALWEVPEEFDAQMMVVRSTNGGGSFAPPVVAADREDGFSDTPWSVIQRQTMWGHQIRWSADGNISISPDNPNEVVIVYSDRDVPNPNAAANPDCIDDAPGDPPNYDPCNAGPSSNYAIWKVESHDGGLHWDPPTLVEDGPGQAWFPWADHLSDGTLVVAWDQDTAASPADTFVHRLKVGSGASTALTPNTAEGRTAVENPDVSITHWAGQYVPQDLWPQICGPAGYTDPPVTDARGKDCNEFHGDYTGLAVGSDGSINITWTGLNRFDVSPQLDFYTGGPHDGYVQDAMFARR